MIHVPANSRDTFTICGTDPGTHNLGLGALHVDMYSLKIRSYEAYTLVATKLMDDSDLRVANHGHTFARTDAHKDELVRLFRCIRPSIIACEDAFFNRRTPGAYSPLLKSINSIQAAVLEYDPYMPFTLIEASVIKTMVGAVGWSRKAGTNKSSVLEALMNNPEFAVPGNAPLTGLTEHAVDSLAIAYTRLKQIR
jgi:Holliday junction resolvasome RuvABC endonuclease subunit